MSNYVGLDVSLKETEICVLAPGGAIVARGRVATEPAALAAWLGEKARAAAAIVMETGGQSSWLCAGLRGFGLEAVIVDARLAKKALSGRANKSDANDAEGLAWLALTGWYRRVAGKSGVQGTQYLTAKNSLACTLSGEALRAQERTGRPLGSEIFIEGLEAHLGRLPKNSSRGSSRGLRCGKRRSKPGSRPSSGAVKGD